jgi:hypothetical protein
MDEARNPEEFMSKAESIESMYYENNRRNVIFNKRSQKQEVAELVTKELSVDGCIQNAIYHAYNSSEETVVVNFRNLKLIAHPDIYSKLCEYGISLITHSIKKNGVYSIAINLDGLTMSAMERFRELIEVFFSLLPDDDGFAQCIRFVTIYNSPSFFDSLYKLVRRFISSDSSHLVLTCLPKSAETAEMFSRL